MARLLYVVASPRSERSYSVRTAETFVAAYRERHPGTEVDTLDLFRSELPCFGEAAAEGKYAIIHGTEASPEAVEAWRGVEAVIERFARADVYVFAVAMWNFGIPYVLKHLFDVVVQPGRTFTVGPAGYQGLLENKRAFVAVARGGAYGPGTGAEAMDFQRPYLETILKFMGIVDQRYVVIEPTLAAGRETAMSELGRAVETARSDAEDF